MSELCKDATAPINITLSDDDKNNKKCDQKCNYICNYKITSSVMTNKEDSIKLTYDNLNSPPVTYNGVKYNVQEMRIFSPSIHTWDESTVSAELIILHSPVEGQTANNLSVSIPIKSSTTTVPSSLGSIISQMNQTGQQSGSRTHLASLDLKDYVPFNAPFFSYNGSLIFDKCRGDENEYVVLDPENSGYKTISEADLTALQKLIQASTITVKANNASITSKVTDVYYNAQGAQQGTTDSEIWIDCKPTGELGETLVQAPGTTFFDDFEKYVGKYIDLNDLGKIYENTYVQAFFAAIVFYIIWKIGGTLIGWLGKPSLPRSNPTSSVKRVDFSADSQIDGNDLL